eukprot:7285966-Prymnesium_polylepis.1
MASQHPASRRMPTVSSDQSATAAALQAIAPALLEAIRTGAKARVDTRLSPEVTVLRNHELE